MALGTKDAASSIFFKSYPSPKLHFFRKSPSSIRFNIFLSARSASLIFASHSLAPALQTARKNGFRLHSGVESVSVEEKVEKEKKPDNRRKLFVLNLPWTFSVADIKKVFGECGTVADVEIIKQKDGKNRGFAFVTMSTGEEAQAVIERFDSYELVGRIIRVQFAKRFKRPPRPVPVDTPAPPRQSGYKLYVSNLPWKARSSNLREFFSSNFNPVSARVVFDSPSGRSAGYGFVSFLTKEEAESAISSLDGKELMGRPIRLKLSERNTDASSNNEEDEAENQQPDAPEANQEEVMQETTA
ncbi:28 kDa ribonucleoprotein, chloroplastic [Andrographis paniculata]|uniref:28 kDa ribonucleoprotein, chloroplastic n=1 Tax=Andrographis paniculata TaxID=175694 RepID=UPI0021E72117|nr:28 kDa ribonucleoprotein, chloroplastic [Andrographis paniculata]XP_051114819.1 28 kDa ribonucleoprotein, chloroplastic [Andrographis paniculata]XP_051114820.1 28 kDa ribonucleoprotein, chloroplastic [Andrographis paniculata]